MLAIGAPKPLLWEVCGNTASFSEVVQRENAWLLTKMSQVRVLASELMVLYDQVRMTPNAVRVVRCRKNIKRKAVAFLGGRCLRCGYSKCIDAMEFHHRDPNQKDFNLSVRGLYRRFDLVQEELKKCDLLCANCHREVHADLWAAKTAQEVIPQRSHWPSKEDLTAWVQKEPLLTLASRLGVSRSTVRNWCKVLGVPLPDHRSRLPGAKVVTRKNPTLWPDPDLLRSMVWKKSVLQLSKDLGVSEVAVKKHCKRLGIETPPRGYWGRKDQEARDKTLPSVSEVRALVASTSFLEASKRLGCDRRTIRSYLLRNAD